MIVTATTLFAVGLVLAPAVQASKPVREPAVLEPLELAAGEGCSFDVLDEPLPGSKASSTTFSNGTTRVTSNSRDRVTNVTDGGSVELNTSGTLSFREEGDNLAIESTGHTLFYFFPGDVGPFGEVGDDGALYYVVGHVAEVLDLNTDVVTSFEWSGRATDVCPLIS